MALIDRLFRIYYFAKFYPFRRERLARRCEETGGGFVGIQIDGLSHPHLRRALGKGYLPNIERHLEEGHLLREYRAGLPSTTPAAQAAFFYGENPGIPAFRWFEKQTGSLRSCNDPDHVQLFRERLFGSREGLLSGGSSYSNILDGGADRSIFTVSSPRPQTLFGRFGGLRILTLLLLHPLRLFRMVGASVLEFFIDRFDRWNNRKIRPLPLSEGLFPFIRIFCNVILRELQTLGVISDIYAGVPRIFTTYSGYDELAHHFGPGSYPAMKSLKYIDRRIGEVMRILRYAPGADYRLIILSDHGQTPGYPFQARFGATLGDTVSAFLKENQQAAVYSGPLEQTRVRFGYLEKELEEGPRSLRNRIYRKAKKILQKKIEEYTPETLKIDAEGGVVVTYSSSLAHLYITGEARRLNWREVEKAHPLLLPFLKSHKGIGFVLAGGEGDRISLFHRGGMACGSQELPPPLEDLAFLRPYGAPGEIFAELCRYASCRNCGDLILFGAYDGARIVCFDDQVGGHGSVGGEQMRPFLVLPTGHALATEELAGYEFLYRQVFSPLLSPCDSGAAQEA